MAKAVNTHLSVLRIATNTRTTATEALYFLNKADDARISVEKKKSKKRLDSTIHSVQQ